MAKSMPLLAATVLLLVFAAFTITPFCGLLFGCGCTFTQGLAHCNIHQSQGPFCPWCSHGQAGFYIPFLLIVSGGFVSAAAALQWISNRFWIGLAAALAGYAFWGVLVGAGTAWFYGYPQLLFLYFGE